MEYEKRLCIQKGVVMKKVFSLILALGMTASLAISCAAEETGENDTTGQEQSTIPWFQQYFSENIYFESESTLTPDQKTLLDANSVLYNQSITQNGYTITLLSGISDGCQSFFDFKIDSPDGTVLDGDYSLTYEVREDLHYKDDTENPSHNGDGNKARVSFVTMSTLEDPNRYDNSVTMLCQCRTSDSTFASGNIQISISEIIESPTNQEEDTWNVVCSGNWTFDIELPEVQQAVELLDSSEYCAAKRCFRRWYFDVSVKVTSFQLRTFSATLLYDKPFTGFWEGITLDPIYLVMDDGSQIKATFNSGANCGDYMECVYVLDLPVAYGNVAYVLFP